MTYFQLEVSFQGLKGCDTSKASQLNGVTNHNTTTEIISNAWLNWTWALYRWNKQQNQVNSSPFLQTDLTSEDVSCEEVVDRDVQRYNRSANRRFMSHRGVTHILSWHLLHDLQHGERYDRRLFFF